MIKKFKEYNESISPNEIEDYLLRLVEVLNCKIYNKNKNEYFIVSRVSMRNQKDVIKEIYQVKERIELAHDVKVEVVAYPDISLGLYHILRDLVDERIEGNVFKIDIMNND